VAWQVLGSCVIIAAAAIALFSFTSYADKINTISTNLEAHFSLSNSVTKDFLYKVKDSH
jgi:hypothetical protein